MYEYSKLGRIFHLPFTEILKDFGLAQAVGFNKGKLHSIR